VSKIVGLHTPPQLTQGATISESFAHCVEHKGRATEREIGNNGREIELALHREWVKDILEEHERKDVQKEKEWERMSLAKTAK